LDPLSWYVETLLAYLFIPPIVMAGLIAVLQTARKKTFSKRCIFVALCCGYASSLASLLLFFTQLCWLGKALTPTLIAPLLLTLALGYAVAKTLPISFSKATFTAVCVFAWLHFSAFYVWWLTDQTRFEHELSLRTELTPAHTYVLP
jgi:hypothetical protein